MIWDYFKRDWRPKGFMLATGIAMLIPVILLSMSGVELLEGTVTSLHRSLRVQKLLENISDYSKNVEILKFRLARQGYPTNLIQLRDQFQKIQNAFDDLAELLKADQYQMYRLIKLQSFVVGLHNLSQEEIVERLQVIDKIVADMDMHENAKAISHESSVKASTSQLVTLSAVAGILAFVLLVFAAFGIRRDMRERIKVQKALEDSEQKAKAGSLMKSRFLATVSHEFRTPLNGIIAYSDLLLQEATEKPLKTKLEIINSSAMTLLRIINDILDFSRIEAGRIRLEDSDFSLYAVAWQTIMALQLKAREKNIALELAVDPSCKTWVRGDSDRVAQILYNLVGNSIKFTSKGFVKVFLHPIRFDDPYHISFTVEDTGRGMDQSQQDLLFKPFEMQLRGTKGENGSGLGLAITKELVTAMKGQIQIDSQMGRGTRVQFDIPFKTPISADIPSDGGSQESATLANFAGHQVLVVEDNPTNQMIAESLLDRFQCDVQVVSNGVEALQLLRDMHFDLILMDCQMPVMDGFEATRRIRQMPKSERPKIVAMTANAHEEDRKRCLDSGMDDVLVKPITSQSLGRTLEKYLRDTEEHRLNAQLTDLADKIGPSGTMKVIAKFKESTLNFADEAEQIVTERDIQKAKRLAHKLKSSTRALGAIELSEVLEQIENDDLSSLRKKTWDEACDLHTKLFERLNFDTMALQRIRDGQASLGQVQLDSLGQNLVETANRGDLLDTGASDRIERQEFL